MIVIEIKHPAGDLVCEREDEHGRPIKATYSPGALELWSEREAREANRRAEIQQNYRDRSKDGSSWVRARRGR